MRRTKIVCTIGPASEGPEVLEWLVLNGMDVARINTSHSSIEDSKKKIEDIRYIAKKCGKNTAIILDLQGPKIRIGKLEKDIFLEDGQKIIFTLEDRPFSDKGANKDLIAVKVDYEKFIDDIKPGCSVFIDDGLLETSIEKVDRSKKTAIARVVRGGVLKSKKGINLPGVSVSVNSVTEKDLQYLDFGIDMEVDFIAQSFVRNAEDIKIIKDRIRSRNSNIRVIAKIEKYEAVDNFDEILDQADCIMVARGDLGIELPEEDVPNIQKEIIRKSNLVGKTVITATQMLDSMIRNPRPTRAEVSDVANAIYDGSDALMLSGETAAGKYPTESLAMMVRVVNKTEESLNFKEILLKKFSVEQNNITEAISFASCEIASVLGASAIITATQSGSTARHISKNKPESIIIGASPNAMVVRQLMLSWGVVPAHTKFRQNIDHMISETITVSRKLGYISSGDRVVVTGGIMVSNPGSTNFINVREII